MLYHLGESNNKYTVLLILIQTINDVKQQKNMQTNLEYRPFLCTVQINCEIFCGSRKVVMAILKVVSEEEVS